MSACACTTVYHIAFTYSFVSLNRDALLRRRCHPRLHAERVRCFCSGLPAFNVHVVSTMQYTRGRATLLWSPCLTRSKHHAIYFTRVSSAQDSSIHGDALILIWSMPCLAFRPFNSSVYSSVYRSVYGPGQTWFMNYFTATHLDLGIHLRAHRGHTQIHSIVNHTSVPLRAHQHLELGHAPITRAHQHLELGHAPFTRAQQHLELGHAPITRAHQHLELGYTTKS